MALGSLVPERASGAAPCGIRFRKDSIAGPRQRGSPNGGCDSNEACLQAPRVSPLLLGDPHVPGEPSLSLPSVARLSGPTPDPWLCVPASRRVCPCREGVSASAGPLGEQPICHEEASGEGPARNRLWIQGAIRAPGDQVWTQTPREDRYSSPAPGKNAPRSVRVCPALLRAMRTVPAAMTAAAGRRRARRRGFLKAGAKRQ